MLTITLSYEDTLTIRNELSVLIAKYDADALATTDPETIAMMKRAADRTRKVYKAVSDAVSASIE